MPVVASKAAAQPKVWTHEQWRPEKPIPGPRRQVPATGSNVSTACWPSHVMSACATNVAALGSYENDVAYTPAGVPGAFLLADGVPVIGLDVVRPDAGSVVHHDETRGIVVCGLQV